MNSKSINIIRPTLVISKNTALNNIAQMTTKAEKSGVIFRPHFKTHQSSEIGEWFRDFCIRQITVSSVQMAEYFAEHGWSDITIAFPVNILEIENLRQLSKKINLNLLVESADTVRYLVKHLSTSYHPDLQTHSGTVGHGAGIIRRLPASSWTSPYFLSHLSRT